MIDPKEHPMLLAEPPLNTQQQREKSGFSIFYSLLITSWNLELILSFVLYAWQGSWDHVWKVQSASIIYSQKSCIFLYSVPSVCLSWILRCLLPSPLTFYFLLLCMLGSYIICFRPPYFFGCWLVRSVEIRLLKFFSSVQKLFLMCHVILLWLLISVWYGLIS